MSTIVITVLDSWANCAKEFCQGALNMKRTEWGMSGSLCKTAMLHGASTENPNLSLQCLHMLKQCHHSYYIIIIRKTVLFQICIIKHL